MALGRVSRTFLLRVLALTMFDEPYMCALGSWLSGLLTVHHPHSAHQTYTRYRLPVTSTTTSSGSSIGVRADTGTDTDTNTDTGNTAAPALAHTYTNPARKR